ncbi:hypothetical protein D9M71_634600 [compost metagenome]
MQDHLPGHGNTGSHVGQAEGHGLMFDQRLAEAFALAGIVTGHLEGGAGHAHRLRGNTDPAAFEVGQGNLVAFALLAQAVGYRHAHVVKDDLAGVGGVLAEFVFNPRHLVTR